MKYFYPLILGLFTMSALLGSCSEQEGPEKFTLSEGRYMLSRTPWSLIGKSINGESTLAECAKDDSLFFKIASGKNEEGEPNPNRFLLKAGPVPCENEVLDSLNSGVWKLLTAQNSTGLSLILYGQKDTVTAAINRITGHFLTLSYLKQEDQIRKEYTVALEGEKEGS